MTNNLNVGMTKYTHSQRTAWKLLGAALKKGLKLIIYVSAAELESVNQDTNQRRPKQTIAIIGIYAFYKNINGSFNSVYVSIACILVRSGSIFFSTHCRHNDPLFLSSSPVSFGSVRFDSIRFG